MAIGADSSVSLQSPRPRSDICLMNRFILIDHSLKDLGGHYYTYASCVLPAAQRAGFSCVLATHQDFRDFDALPRSWHVHAIFRRKSYSQRTPDVSESGRLLHEWWGRVRHAWRTRKRLHAATGFAEDCAALFERVRLQAGDHVFIATASELDLEGLGLFLQSRADCRGVNWHLQFHLGIFRGRDPDYSAQRADTETMRQVFQGALDALTEHRVRLYCTTEQLSAQYARLGVAEFRTLPYPVHPLFRENHALRPAHEPARIACLGHSRREKGYRELPVIVRSLWNDYLRTGRAQLLLQTRRLDLRRRLDAVVAELGGNSATPAIAYAEFPLELEQYAALVRSADVGMFLYDSARYYARCSGVLLEMLSAGVPVIVPAGCWLAEQISEENQGYLEGLAAGAGAVHCIGAEEPAAPGPRPGRLGRNAPRHDASRISFTDTPSFSEVNLPADGASLLLRFRWLSPESCGTYARIDLEQFNSRGTRLSCFASIAGPRPHQEQVHVMFHLNSGATRARLRWSNAWDTGPISLARLEYVALVGEQRPAGAVGLTAADLGQTAELLHDILQHIEHYRRAAAQFATRCAQHHNADQVIAQLTATAHYDVHAAHGNPT